MDNWKCRACNHRNDWLMENCMVCDRPRPKDFMVAAQSFHEEKEKERVEKVC